MKFFLAQAGKPAVPVVRENRWTACGMPSIPGFMPGRMFTMYICNNPNN